MAGAKVKKLKKQKNTEQTDIYKEDVAQEDQTKTKKTKNDTMEGVKAKKIKKQKNTEQTDIQKDVAQEEPIKKKKLKKKVQKNKAQNSNDFEVTSLDKQDEVDERDSVTQDVDTETTKETMTEEETQDTKSKKRKRLQKEKKNKKQKKNKDGDTADAEAEQEDKVVQFHEMGLDDRILEAIARLGWSQPTLIQEKAVPYVLQGKDVMAKARTGTGKTGAFLIPLLHKVLEWKRTATEQTVQAIILAPSKELSKQIADNIRQLTIACRDIRFTDVSPTIPLEAQRPLLTDKPDIVVGTPMRIAAHLEEGNLDVKTSLKMLVVDEADLMLAYNYVTHISSIIDKLPKIFQSFVTSATMFDNLQKVKRLVLHNPVNLRLEEPVLPTDEQLVQYVIKLHSFEKVVLTVALLKLNLISGKTLIFVNTVDKGYRIKMFLSQFNIQACLLNSEMPAESRYRIIEEFNKGKYDIIIASDEHNLEGKTDPGAEASKREKDKEFGVARGIDFQLVSNIVNFDFPLNTDSYVHRVGRTARGNCTGTALSLVAPNEKERFDNVEAKLQAMMPNTQQVFKDFKFDFAQLDGFRYRATEAWRRCSDFRVRETRKKEIQLEILNSTRLKSFFEKNPKDLEFLNHNKSRHSLQPMAHLKHVPDYNVPDMLKRKGRSERGGRKVKQRQEAGGRAKKPITQAQKKFRAKSGDPLKSMQFKGFKKV